jgi:hypothetical protein
LRHYNALSLAIKSTDLWCLISESLAVRPTSIFRNLAESKATNLALELRKAYLSDLREITFIESIYPIAATSFALRQLPLVSQILNEIPDDASDLYEPEQAEEPQNHEPQEHGGDLGDNDDGYSLSQSIQGLARDLQLQYPDYLARDEPINDEVPPNPEITQNPITNPCQRHAELVVQQS